jgi:monofunctional biosynthetic peptidoglycan transglycosylase
MKLLSRALVWIGVTLGLAAICLAGAISVGVLSNGVLSTAAPAWIVEVHVAGHAVRVNVAGLVRLATAPGVAQLLDGRGMETPAGHLVFRRSGRTTVALCSPCRLQHPELANAPLVSSRLELGAERTGATVNGWVAGEGFRVEYTAHLAADRIRLQWQLPATDLAAVYGALASVIPEARSARIEGSLQAQGVLELPGRRSSVAFGMAGLEVGGLGTEALQFGWFRMSCAHADGSARRVVTGDGEARWVALDRMGYLPAAVIAAEDQRFREHAGIDETEVALLLADLDDNGPKRGASTLTQQLARTLYTGGERTAARKLRELLYAVEMERTLGKSRILELYLNTVDWGPGLCGARSAARTYFRKRPDQLTPLEAAWLAGILRAPHVAHGHQFLAGQPEVERARRVLMQMRELPKAERVRWAGKPLVLAVAKKAATNGSATAAVRPSGAPTIPSTRRDADRDAPVAEPAVESAEAPGHRRRALRAAAVVGELMTHDAMPVALDQHRMARRAERGAAFAVVHVTGVHVLQPFLVGDAPRTGEG